MHYFETWKMEVFTGEINVNLEILKIDLFRLIKNLENIFLKPGKRPLDVRGNPK